MKIATWNVGGCFIKSTNNQEYDLESTGYFINELKNINPDIVCFQEIHISEGNNQPKVIAEALDFQYIETHSVSDSHLKDNEKLSISIISKFPIVSSKFNILPNPNLQFIWKGKLESSHDKGFLEAIVDYNGVNIKIFSGHMVPFRKFDKNPLDDEFFNIRNELEKIILIEDMPKVICADMNFGSKIEELLPNVFSKGFKFILEDIPTTPRLRKYDKIIISKEWEKISSSIIEGKADHFLCFAEINFRG